MATPDPTRRVGTPSQEQAQALLTEVFGDQEDCRLVVGDRAAYQSLRLREPQLVSLVDGKPPGTVAGWEVMGLWWRTRLLGALSFQEGHNTRRPAPHDRYARIDVVVVPDTLRGLGAGRVLLACATAFLLRSGEAPPYSISCLAAHPAVAHTLEDLGFQPQPRDGLNYVHEELTVDPAGASALADRCAAGAATTLRRLRYALRQRSAGATP